MSSSGWIGVDLDGTLAEYKTGDGIETIGPPIPVMLERVKHWVALGVEVRIVTARVAACNRANDGGVVDSVEFAAAQDKMIREWCKEHVGQELQTTACKDFQMVELWDDRARQVISNTGVPLLNP